MMTVELRRCSRTTMLLKVFTSFNDVIGERVDQSAVQVWAYDNAQTVHFLCVRRHSVGRKHPAVLTHLLRKSNSLNLFTRLFSVKATTGIR